MKSIYKKKYLSAAHLNPIERGIRLLRAFQLAQIMVE